MLRPESQTSAVSDDLSSQRWRWVLAGLGLLTALSFSPTVLNGFVKYDDDYYLTANAMVQRGLTADGFVFAWTSFTAANWHPLTWLGLMLDWQLFGPWAGGHHLTSLVLHVLTVVLVAQFVRELLGDWKVAAVVAALFGVHPLRVESVAWAAELKDVLCGVFFMAACLAYLRAVRSGQGRWAAWTWCVLALLAKPMAVTLPMLFLVMDWWPLKRVTRATVVRLGLEKWPIVLACFFVVALTFYAQAAGGTVSSLEQMGKAERLASVLTNAVSYLRLTVFPVDLLPFYPYRAPAAGEAAVSALVLGAICALVYRLRRNAPVLLFGWAWFLVTLLPVIGIVKVGAHSIADRYTYLPHVGLLAALCGGGARLLERRALAVLAAMTVAVFSGSSLLLTRSWESPSTLFGRTLEIDEFNPMANLALGVEANGARDYVEGERLLTRAVEGNPGLSAAWANLGSALTGQGRMEDALRCFQKAHDLAPGDPDLAWALGNALTRSSRAAEALPLMEPLHRAWPDRPRGAIDYATALVRAGRPTEAVEVLRAHVRTHPGELPARVLLATTLVTLGDVAGAKLEVDAALSIDPASVTAAALRAQLEGPP